jgi:hypothetical protein
MTLLAISFGTVGFAVLLLVGCVLAYRLVSRVFPQDPPPVKDGESIASRIRGLRWE